MLFSQTDAAALSAAQKDAILFGKTFGRLPPPCHAALVLGGGIDDMRSRAASAAALLARVPVGKVIACGGVARQFGGEALQECEILCRLLREGGVSAEIVTENNSKDTIENILFALTLLKNDLMSQKRLNLAVITSPWHLRRATELAKCLFPRTVSVYGYHSDYGRQRLTGECSPALITQAENELRFLHDAVECGFADDFEI